MVNQTIPLTSKRLYLCSVIDSWWKTFIEYEQQMDEILVNVGKIISDPASHLAVEITRLLLVIKKLEQEAHPRTQSYQSAPW